MLLAPVILSAAKDPSGVPLGEMKHRQHIRLLFATFNSRQRTANAIRIDLISISSSLMAKAATTNLTGIKLKKHYPGSVGNLTPAE